MAEGIRKFRSFTSLVLAVAFLMLVVTGVVLYVVPEGRVANWVNWELLGLLKNEWANVHIVFAIIFLVAGVLHLYPYNWITFKAYLARRRQNRLDFRHPKKEVIFAVIFSFLLGGGAIASLPPISYVFDLNAWAKSAWVVSPEYEPPFGHAEELSLVGFARKMNMDLEKAVAELRARGVKFEGPKESLGQIAEANGTTAMDLYILIKPFERKPEPKVLASYTAEEVEVQFAGMGVGRKTLAEMSTEIGMPIGEVQAKLSTAGIKADADETMKEISSRHDITPIDVLKKILVGAPVEQKAECTTC